MASLPRPVRRGRFRPMFERFEARRLPTTILVTTLADSGPGSLRQAMFDAELLYATTIDFKVAGTIQLISGPLPGVILPIRIDGSTAPGFKGTPVVAVDQGGFAGLRFSNLSKGSTLQSLSLTHASGAGVTLESGQIALLGNYIGVRPDGKTAAGNSGDGVLVEGTSTGDTIGGLGSTGRDLISGNLGNGIDLEGASGAVIVNNYIGTDATGMHVLGNGNNGIALEGASGNVIGGRIPGEKPGVKPQDFVGTRPPLGNVISGNGGDGVLMANGSDLNELFGNFIGTAATGTKGVGNMGDGVAIVGHSDGNILQGTIFVLDPFIYFNVIDANGGNGVRVDDSDNTAIQANFLGLGSDDKTPLGNRLNGLLVQGTSTITTLGGPIPLGNVIAANGKNGVAVNDTASGFTSENTFAGLGAFVDYKNLGNHGDGFSITSTGGNNLLRINVASGNGGDGVHIAGDASGVRVYQNIIGLNTAGKEAFANGGDGIEVGGTAHENLIGGTPDGFSIIQIDTISANRGYGVALTGAAHDNQLNFAHIGTIMNGLQAVGNAEGGVLVGPGTRSTTIGSTDPSLPTVISGNHGNGITLVGTFGNSIIGTKVGVNMVGRTLGNAGDGISIVDGSDNRIGGTSAGEGDLIGSNRLDGVSVASGDGNAIRGNGISGNRALGIRLAPGANDGQQAPVLTSADGSSVSGGLVSTPNTAFAIDLYFNPDGASKGTAQGATFFGSETVTTDVSGVATFIFEGLAGPGVYTATATDPLGNTSEFSNGRHD